MLNVIAYFENVYYVYGPFNSVEKAAEKICSIGSIRKAGLKKYQCYDINLDKGTYIKTSDYFLGKLLIV